MKNKKGFTLIELLVVVLIIGILAAIALPQYKWAVEKSKAATMLPLVSSLHKAINICLLEKGSVCTMDELSIDITNAEGNKITQTNISKNNQNPTPLNKEYGISYSGGNTVFITRMPYAGIYYFDWVLRLDLGTCQVRGNGSHPKGIKLMESLGYKNPTNYSGWMWYPSCN
jgi:prepilin-type N-terminal cleavage/methylation domain-containing protein